jgi:hypothetical protein
MFLSLHALGYRLIFCCYSVNSWSLLVVFGKFHNCVGSLSFVQERMSFPF